MPLDSVMTIIPYMHTAENRADLIHKRMASGMPRLSSTYWNMSDVDRTGCMTHIGICPLPVFVKDALL